ncbi:UvrD-helicase domain-containing protein [Ignatzschineria sp. LJL83]
MKLNPEQASAVHHIHTPLLVLAGAGSGKTRVITEKIKYLIEKQFFDPRSIFAVTFTNKAAKEMADRLAGTLGKEKGRKVKVSTFHTLGLSILKKHGNLLGLRKGFSIYDQKDTFQLMESLIESDAETIRIALDRISSWKNDMRSLESLKAEASDEYELALAELYERYQAQLLSYNAIDFDDLILLPMRLLQENEEVRRYWQKEIRYLLVDEYQDTNLCQYELVKLLIGKAHHLTVVGDDDQSIYAWRGARPENLHQLKVDFTDLTLVKLEQNYRSTGHILKAANHVIALNPHLYDKSLWSNLGDGEKIEIRNFKSAEAEAEYVATTIVHDVMLHGGQYQQYAVLYRGNHQSRIFEMALRMRGIPVKVVGGSSFFQQPEVKDLLSYLKLILNPADNPSLLRIINIPKREIGAITLKKITEFAAEHRLTLFETLEHPHLGSFIGKNAQKCAAFAKMIRGLSQYEMDVETLFDKLTNAIGYQDYLKDQSSSPKAFERKQNSVNALREWFAGESAPLGDILSNLTLISILENQNEEKDENAVTLMTLHSAKGLEFPYVFMVGLEEDILPHRNSIDNDTIEEERRLFYVGVTRARQKLDITYCRQRKRYGEWESCQVSRFLRELPEANILWHKEGEAPSKEAMRENTSNTLAGLQAMLDTLER